jgi:DNA primase
MYERPELPGRALVVRPLAGADAGGERTSPCLRLLHALLRSGIAPLPAELVVPDDLSHDFKETVRAHTDIVSLIGETVRLQSVRGGREFIGLCPFHDDHNPSMRVYPDRQSYRCWSCNAGGDCFTFVMESDRLEFRDALELLANRAKLSVPKRAGRPAPPGQEKTALLEALLWAEGLFHHTLLKDESAAPARAYLAERGFTAETMAKFKLGFHPNDWEWLQRKAQGRFSTEQLVAAGLCGKREGSGGCFDYFVGRVLFPIHNERGQPVGFGGRVLPGTDDSFGKYFNSLENPVFHKSRLVYAIDHAREGLKASETAVVTEGYTDCIIAHQAGLTNVVATLGTALTEMQVTTIKRFARKVVLVYDGDQAGRDAAARAVGRFLAQDVDLRILTLPDGQDPAEYISEHGPEAFAQQVAAAPEALEFVFDRLEAKFGFKTIDSRNEVLNRVVAVLADAPRLYATPREKILLGRTAEKLRIKEEDVRERYRKAREESARRHSSVRPSALSEPSLPDSDNDEHISRILKGQPTRDDRLECELAQILIAVPRLTDVIRQSVGALEIANAAVRSIVQIYYDWAELGEPVRDFSHLLAALDETPSIKQLAVWLDEQARIKNLEFKLCHDAERGDDDFPLILRRLLENLQWRREEESHHRTAIELSEAGEGAHGLDEETKRLLRQLAEFHQKRATKRTKSA